MLGILIWGSMSDYFGRNKTLIIGLIVFEIGSIGAYFSLNEFMLLAFRSIQEFAIAVLYTQPQGYICDVFTESEMGFAQGIQNAFTGLAVTVSPFIGSILLEAWGWNTIFPSSAVFGFFILLQVLFTIPETFHSIAQTKFLANREANTQVTRLIKERDSIKKTIFENPLKCLRFLLDRKLLPYYLLACFQFTCVNGKRKFILLF